ncbi:hypothetical protein DD235_09520 [Corticimicrobacter populi]|uniref:Uncharacterized protein n=1 Tax=Corticimicrobacter populi TaxID=2175229 RepID=A0A2V1JXY2_9BURK|nr:hypothetical protein DD235_09520 [Corticimicrobacter populi]
MQFIAMALVVVATVYPSFYSFGFSLGSSLVFLFLPRRYGGIFDLVNERFKFLIIGLKEPTGITDIRTEAILGDGKTHQVAPFLP